jgi:PAS domain S-box-containing protein
MMNDMIPPELETLLGRGLFEHVPFNAAVIDRDFNIVAANKSFEEYFGDWRRKKCHEVYKGSAQRCASCQAQETFEDGRVRVSDETGVNRHGRACHYVVHLAPVKDGRQEVRYIIEMTTDLTETRRWQREYDLFLERVPCCVLVVDRQFRIIRDNEKFRQTFGEGRGKLCYEVCKRRKTICTDCPAALTFNDGAEHASSQVGVHRDGSPAYYVVTSSPLSRGAGGVAHVIEMATDVTDVRHLQGELRKAQDYYKSLIRNSGTGIVAVDMLNQAKIMNHAARALLGWNIGRLPGPRRLRQMLPAEFFGPDLGGGKALDLPEALIRPRQGPEVPVRFSAVGLKSRGKRLGRAAFLQDLREVKSLEQDKLEAERLAAVGQTVAGLAHTIKNLLMGLEGGMYMVDSGLHRGDAARIAGGWEILQRNFEKTTVLVKDFLSFAKGRVPDLRPTDPAALARSIVELYRDAARMQGVELVLEPGEGVSEALLDPNGIETALTNLLSNAIDAAALRETPGGKVVLRIRDDAKDLLFEVSDNGCGMDWEVKGKVFTSFFTTKGGKGTGLGLLTTRKIVQEHGGRFEMESAVGEGSLFRMRFPRQRLQTLAEAAARGANGKSAGAVPNKGNS